MDKWCNSPTNLVRCIQAGQLLNSSISSRRQYFTQRLASSSKMYTRDLRGHYGCVNGIGLSHYGNEFLVSGGDDQRVLVWNVAAALNGTSCTPTAMETKHFSNIFAVNFSCDNSYVYSAGNDGQIIQHDFTSRKQLRMYNHNVPVYCVDPHPSCPYTIALATDDGNIIVADTRTPSLSMDMVVDESSYAYHSVAFNPLAPHLLVTGSEISGTSLFDIRQSKRLIEYRCSSYPVRRTEALSVCFNSTGTRIFSLYKSLPPCVFDTFSEMVQFYCVDDEAWFDIKVTLKSGCFAGSSDEYVVSGSDDFRVYWWRIPNCYTKPKWQSIAEIPVHLVMPGHRSIVNQARYSTVHQTLFSSGVEKIIKLWTSFPCSPDAAPVENNAPPSRERFSQAEYAEMSQDLEMHELHELNSHSQVEDPLTLALFDHLIEQDSQREMDASSSSSSEIVDEEEESSEEDICDSEDSEQLHAAAAAVSGYVAQSPSTTSDEADDDPRYLDKLSYRLTLYKLMEEKEGGSACHSEDDDHTSSELTEANTSSVVSSHKEESESEESSESEDEESDIEVKYQFDGSDSEDEIDDYYDENREKSRG